MKKIWFFILLILVGLTSCVKDELPESLKPQPPGTNYKDVKLNELIAKDVTNPYYVDASGKAADWVELYNTGNDPVNIAGLWITDNPGVEADYQKIPSGDQAVTTIPPQGFLVLICGASDASGNKLATQIQNGKIFVDFGISSSKDHKIALYDLDKKQLDITDDFNGLNDDKSFGRVPDGSGTWKTLASKSPGKVNDTTAQKPGTLVINEFMSSNDSFYPGPNNDYPDWIEIYNTGDTDIDLGGWYITDNLDEMKKCQIPTGHSDKTTVHGHGFVVLICDGTGAASGPLFTNFKLSSGGESIGLSKDGTTFTDKLTYGSGGDIDPGPKTDWSAGRDSDGGSKWILFDPNSNRPPTPGKSNNK
jgi:hypothetical protein